MDTKIVRLNFLAPVHFGDGRLSGSEYSCDAATLFSALFIEALRTGADGLLLEAARSGEFSISDAFPFVGDTLYFPKPMMPSGAIGDAEPATGAKPQEQGLDDSIMKKAFKKLRFIPADNYHDYFTGSFDPVFELKRFSLGKSALQTKVNLTRAHKDDAEPYHVGGFCFNENAGLYFIVRGSYDVSPLLKQLQYSGIGGERSSGYGRFEYELSGKSPLQPSPTDRAEVRFVLLASAAPAPEELNERLLAGAYYGLKRKGGFVQSFTHSDTPQKKRDFYTFAAGSVFSRKFDGDIFDVNAIPGAHPVYRYAKVLWMEV
jgi:CRISPR-associated protein Csm4